jgi:SAM-dependent methyltransferase
MIAALHRVRVTTLALSTAAFIALSAVALAQDAARPSLDVPYVPTPPEVVDKMLDMAAVKAGDYVIDLGCGDGRIAIAAAKRGAKALGVDIDPARIQDANDNARKDGMAAKVSFRQQNLFETEIYEASVISMYLLTSINLKLRPRLLDLKPGTRIVSHAFELGEWRPDEIAQIGFRHAYLWIVPAKANGRWKVQTKNEAFELELEQSFQQVSGQAYFGGKVVAAHGKMRGSELEVRLVDGLTLRGRVEGDRIQATQDTSWQASRIH